MPEESGKTVIKRISKGGLPALGDWLNLLKNLLTILDSVGIKTLPSMPIKADTHSITIMRRKATAALATH